MTETFFRIKTDEEQITLRAADEATDNPEGSNEADVATNSAEQKTGSINIGPEEPSDSSKRTKSPADSSDPEDLLDVITNPHAGEQDWIAACNELDRQNRRKERNEFNARQNNKERKKKLAMVVAVVLAVFASGIAASNYFHFGESTSSKKVADTKSEVKKKINFKPYMKSLQREIRSHWQPPKSDVPKQIQVHFKVAKSGEISNIGFDRLSRDAEADAAVLKSVIASMPSSPALPDGSPESVDVSFTFNYEVDKKQN